MSLKHIHTLRGVNSGAGVGSTICLACSSLYLATPHLRNTDIGVWSLSDVTYKPLDLVGHRKRVTALAFNAEGSSTTLLCSAGTDYVIVWNIEKAHQHVATGTQVRGQVIGTTLGSVQYLSFSPDNRQIAVCVDQQVLILDARREETLAVLEGHTSYVNCAEFCPHYSATVVSISDDRTFKVWDVSGGQLVYQSTIISSSPFISMAMHPQQPSVAIGTTDGVLRVYDLSDGNDFRCLHTFIVDKAVRKQTETRDKNGLGSLSRSNGPVTISSHPSWQQRPPPDEEEAEPAEVDMETGYALLALKYVSTADDGASARPPPPNLPFLHQDHALVSDLLGSAPSILLLTSAHLLQVNTKTLELTSCTHLTEQPVPSDSMVEAADKTLPLVGSAALSSHPTASQQVWCALAGLFSAEINLLSVQCIQTLGTPAPLDSAVDRLSLDETAVLGDQSDSGSLGASFTGSTSAPVISVLSSDPLAPDSPLTSELVLKSKNSSGKQNAKAPGSSHTPGSLSKQGHIVDKQPITFHNKVKSSGYQATPRKTMFQPKISTPKGPTNTTPSKGPKPSPSLLKEYPMECGAPCQPQNKVEVAERPTAVSCVSFSGDGHNLATAQANTVVQSFKMPLTGKGSAFLGHNGSVSSVSWSHDGAFLISASDDRTAKIWSLGCPDPVMDVTAVNNNMAADREAGVKPDKKNPLFSKPVCFAQFYYVDKFFLLTSGNSFYLYKYHLDLTKSDIKRYLSSNKYKLVRQFQMSEAQNITAFSAVNSFHSHLAFCGGSNKSVEVFDLNRGQSVRIIPQVHTKAPHTLCLNVGSLYASPPLSAYDLFVTAASSDCIKLWDLRSNRCAQRYEGHCNRSQPCGLAMSPCSRFLATGSEDRCAYIYDVRSSTYLHKLTGHTDTVSDVAFHPLHPKLVTATLDGKLRVFTEH